MTDAAVETPRLILRRWREEDLAPFHAMGQDAEVVRFLGLPATLENGDRAAIGFCGLLPAKAPIEGEVEVGWRLARDCWGQGIALEAARASLDWGWRRLDVPAIAAVTVADNTRSRALMERLGMTRVAGGDVDHPALPSGDPLRRHVLYRIERPA